MHPKIVNIHTKKLVGIKLPMSFINNKTMQLWQSFMPRRKEIHNRVNNELVSMSVYPDVLRLDDLNHEFERWAAVEVSDFSGIPAEMETFILPAGVYAVFHYKGLSTDSSIFTYIFTKWLPDSGFLLDNRPHF